MRNLDRLSNVFLVLVALLYTCSLATGLAVLLYPSLDETYFNLIFLHQGIALVGLVAVTTCLAFFVNRLSRRIHVRLIAWMAVLFACAVILFDLKIAFLLPWTLLHIGLVAWLLQKRTFRATALFLFFTLLANLSGIEVYGGDQWKIAPFIHGLCALLPLFCLALALAGLRTPSGVLQHTRRLVSLAAVAVALVCIPWWYKKNFGSYSEETFQNEGPGQTNALSSRPEPADLLQSRSCGVEDCHNVYYDQWAASTHRFSSNNRLFRRVVELAREDNGLEGIRSCVNCHDPVATLSNAGLASWPHKEPGNDEGVNCKVCHLMRGGDYEKGNGVIRIARETKYPYQDAPIGSPEFEKFKSFVRSDPRQHVRTYRAGRSFAQSEYCVPCHLVTVDRKDSDQAPLRLHLLYQQWAESPWRERFTCQECHMPIFQIGPRYYRPKDHRFLGLSTIHGTLALRLAQEDQERLENHSYFTKRYLDGTLLLAKEDMLFEPKKGLNRLDYPVRDVGLGIALSRGMVRQKRMLEYLRSGPLLSVTLDAKVTEKESVRILDIEVATANARVGHEFPSGPLDLVRCWCEITATDALGRTIWLRSGLNAQGDVPEDGMYLGCRGLLDAQGNKIEDHRFWRAHGTIGKQVLAPFEKRVDTLTFSVPDDMKGDLTINATWRYYRISPKILDLLLNESFPAIEPLVVGSATAVARIQP